MQRKFTRALMNADDKRFSVDKKFYVLHDKVFMNKYLLNTHKFMWRTELTHQPHSHPPPPAGNYTFKVNNRDSRKRCAYVQNKPEDTRTTPIASFWCLYCQPWICFTPCSTISIVNFEHVNTGCVTKLCSFNFIFYSIITRALVFKICFTTYEKSVIWL